MADGSVVLEGEVLEPERGLVVPGPQMLVQPHPFSSERQRIEVPEGWTLEDMVRHAGFHEGLFPALKVYVGGDPVPQALWRLVKPKRNAVVYVACRPGKGAIRVIAMLAVVVAAFYLGPLVTGFLGLTGFAATAVATVVETAVMFAGQALVNKLIPIKPPQQTYGFNQELGNPYAQITGLANQAAPYGPIPRVYGKKRMYPMLAARPYTELGDHDTQYLRMLLMVGYGPLHIADADIKIGETPITEFEDAQWEVIEGWPTDGPPTLFNDNIQEDVYQVLLADAGDTITKTTHLNTEEASLDLSALGGLVRMDDNGNMNSYGVEFTVQWSVTGAGVWHDAAWENGNAQYGTDTNGRLGLNDKSQSAVMRSGRFLVSGASDGRYDIKVTRITAKDTSGRVADAVYLTCIRSICSGSPAPMKNVCYLSLRLKATGQLNGAPDQINVIAQSYLQVYDTGTASWSWAISRSPAWAYADILKRRGGTTIIADSQIDLTTIAAWAADCASTPLVGTGPYWAFDGVFEGGSMYSALQQIAQHGRAAFTMRDGKYSVVQDKAQTVPAQVFTPRNSWGYTGSKSFVDLPDAFRINFINASKGYVQDQAFAYRAGYNKDGSGGLTAAQRFDTIDMPGCTNVDQAVRDGNYHMAALVNRPEQHTIMTDVENLRCTLGDLVQFSHDVIEVGLNSGRVIGVTTSGSTTTAVILDQTVNMAVGTSYAVRLRNSDGSSVLCPITTVAGDQNVLTLTTPITTATSPGVGALYVFGVASLESAPMIVQKIEPGPDLSAKLTLVDADQGVWNADHAALPAFTSYITQPRLPQYTSPSPIDFTLDSGALAFSLLPDGTVRGRISINFAHIPAGSVPVDTIDVQYQNANSPDWIVMPRLGKEARTAWINDVYSGDNYSVRARTVAADGRTSDWTTHTIQANGKVVPPGDPSALTVTNALTANVLKWTNPVDYDLDHTEVWAAATNNRASATKITTVPAPFATYTHAGLTVGATWYYWVRAVDSSGNLSPDYYPVSATAGIGATVSGVTPGDVDTTPPGTLGGAPSITLKTGVDPSGTAYAYMHITWTALTDADLASYLVEISDSSGTVDFVSKSNSYDLRGLKGGDTYTVKVKGVDKGGNLSAAFSPAATVTVPAPGQNSNLVPDGALTLKGSGWNLSGFGVGVDPQLGPYLGTSASGSYASTSAQFAVSPSTAYIASCMAGYLHGSSGTFSLQIEWLNSGGASLGTTTAANFPDTSVTNGYGQITTTGNSPSTAAFARLKISAAGASFSAGLGAFAYHFKAERGSVVTPWNDDSTTGALYTDGTDINSLKPTDAGATKNKVFRAILSSPPTATGTGDFWIVVDGSGNGLSVKQWNGTAWITPADLTAQNVASGITGQGTLATQSQVDWASQITGVAKPADSATKNLIYYQSATPSSPTVNDIWVQLSGTTPVAVLAWTGSVWKVGADLTSVNTASGITGQSAWATYGTKTPTNVLQFIDSTGHLTVWTALPGTNTALGMGVTMDSYPFTADSSHIYVAAFHLTGYGQTAISVASSTISGLSADTSYGIVYNINSGVLGQISPDVINTFVLSPDGWVFLGVVKTQTSGGTYNTSNVQPAGYVGGGGTKFQYSYP